MKKIFNTLDQKEFEKRFSSDEQCLKFLVDEKWKNGFICRKCGHTNYCEGAAPYSRRCTKCKHQESATAHTIFHRCKIPIHEAFMISFLVCSLPEVSSHEISRKLNIRQMTCWNFKKKISKCIDERGDLSILQKEELKKEIKSNPAD
ncbi:MAG: transposase [Bacteroidales bacterium]|nr:transposase [Bacteroidales bacterium]